MRDGVRLPRFFVPETPDRFCAEPSGPGGGTDGIGHRDGSLL
jgi:hypothetical protein